jgi:beta-glucosidase
MNSSLSPQERADFVLKQRPSMKSSVHGSEVAHKPRWQMALSELTDGGAGYVEGVKRLGIPPLVISDAGYGVRSGGRTVVKMIVSSVGSKVAGVGTTDSSKQVQNAR